jgi:hypothetical protein
MGFLARVESVTNCLNVWHPDGYVAGKAILSFLDGAFSYCIEAVERDDVVEWFGFLSQLAQEDVCNLTESLRWCFYSGDWSYEEDEYEFFLARSPEMPISKEEFKKTIADVRRRWVDAAALLLNVKKLANLFTVHELPDTWFYDAKETPKQFQALARTIETLISFGSEEVRIRFE